MDSALCPVTCGQGRWNVVKSKDAPRSEDRGGGEGGRVLGEVGSYRPPFHQLGDLASAVSSPSSKVPAKIDFCMFLIPQETSSRIIFGDNSNVRSQDRTLSNSFGLRSGYSVISVLIIRPINNRGLLNINSKLGLTHLHTPISINVQNNDICIAP